MVDKARNASGSDRGLGSNVMGHDRSWPKSSPTFKKVRINVGSASDTEDRAPGHLALEDDLLPAASAAAERQCLK